MQVTKEQPTSGIKHWDDSRCCCHDPDARECFRSRHHVENEAQECECVCHEEYRHALDDAGEYEEYYP